MRIETRDEASIAAARVELRALAGRVGVPPVEAEAAALILSELGHNQLRHARRGVLTVQAWGDDGVEVIATDEGGGMEDVAAAFTGRSTAASLGAGLGSVRRLATELDVQIQRGEGCVFAARVRPGGRRGRELFSVGRPHPTERISGDVTAWHRAGDRLVVALVDGLGHGILAREAADAAVLGLHADEALDDTVRRVHNHVKGTRGVTMAVARVHAGRVEVGVVGNVRVGVFGPGGTRRASQTPGTLGLGAAPRTLHPDHLPFGPQDRLVMWTDGLRDQLTIDRVLPPSQLAPELLARWGRDTDDATVVVVS